MIHSRTAEKSLLDPGMAPLSTVASSPSSTGTSFHRETIFALGRSLAKIPDVGWNEVERALFVHCPKIGDDNQVIICIRTCIFSRDVSSISQLTVLTLEITITVFFLL